MLEFFDIDFKTIFLILIVFIAGVSVGYAIFSFTYKIPSKGEVSTIGINIVNEENQSIKEIDWGIIDPGSSKTIKVYAYNNGTMPVILDYATDNWNPQNASDYIILTWDYDGQTIQPGAKIPINLTLKVLSTISGIKQFSFDILIMATGG